MQLTERDEKRFWSKVALPNEQGCMLWLRGLRDGRYGCFGLNGKTVQAHRISYTLAYGEIPDGLVIDHVKDRGCTSPRCVAPEHLEAVTQAENMRRGDPNAHQKAKTHCPANHLYDEANTYQYPTRVERACRACRRAASARYRAKRKVMA